MTNAGVADICVNGSWFTEASDQFRIGLLQGAQPAAVDTQAEVRLLNWVIDLTSVATECDFTGYNRLVLTRSGAEDDPNNRANLTVPDAVWNPAGGATNNSPSGFFTYFERGGTDATRRLVSVRWFAPADINLTFGGVYTAPFSNPIFTGAN